MQNQYETCISHTFHARESFCHFLIKCLFRSSKSRELRNHKKKNTKVWVPRKMCGSNRQDSVNYDMSLLYHPGGSPSINRNKRHHPLPPITSIYFCGNQQQTASSTPTTHPKTIISLSHQRRTSSCLPKNIFRSNHHASPISYFVEINNERHHASPWSSFVAINNERYELWCLPNIIFCGNQQRTSSSPPSQDHHLFLSPQQQRHHASPLSSFVAINNECHHPSPTPPPRIPRPSSFLAINNEHYDASPISSFVAINNVILHPPTPHPKTVIFFLALNNNVIMPLKNHLSWQSTPNVIHPKTIIFLSHEQRTSSCLPNIIFRGNHNNKRHHPPPPPCQDHHLS